MHKLGVIGVGNPLRRDDGIGILLLEHLRKQQSPFAEHITLIDGGTASMNLLPVLSRFEHLLIIDATDFHGIPGTVRVFHDEEVQSRKAPLTLSTHQQDILPLIRIARELDNVPRTIKIFGIQPKDTSFGQGLSPELENKVPSILKQLQSFIKEVVGTLCL